MHRRSLAVPLALLATFVLATAALAGGWAQVTVTDPPVDPPAGGATIIGLDVLQHGVTPVSWPRLTVVATNTTTGAVVRAAAKADGAAGHYEATLTIPAEGTWTLSFASEDLEMAGTATLSVGPSVPVANATPPTAASAAVDPAVAIVLGIASVIVIGLMIAGVRARRDQAGTVTG